MFVRKLPGPGLALALLGLSQTATAQDAAPCQAVREHTRETVVVFQSPSTFTVCRNGSVESGVVTGRGVYLEVLPGRGPRMFDFRLRGSPNDLSPAGLGAWEAFASKVTARLRDLDHAGETLADVAVPVAPPVPGGPLRALAAARTQYLADVTPKYVEALHEVRGDARELPVVAALVRRWCGALAAEPSGSLTAGAETSALCSRDEVREGVVDRLVDELESAADVERTASLHARDATLGAIAHPEDPKAAADATTALDEARLAASHVVSSARSLRRASASLARDVATLHAALRSTDALRPGVPAYLSTYSTPGNAELEIEATPVDVPALGADGAHTRSYVTGRFAVFGRHYLDIEAGMAWSGGVPDSPYVTTIQGNQVIQGKPVDELTGLALVELEPMRFLWPEKPAAGVVRLPVIGIPFTRNPTSNFYVGGGLGWTGVGSVTLGPYFIRETTLRQGFHEQEILPAGVPFGATTVAGVRVGYFVSASVDLVGLFHLFVRERTPAIDALTGKEK